MQVGLMVVRGCCVSFWMLWLVHWELELGKVAVHLVQGIGRAVWTRGWVAEIDEKTGCGTCLRLQRDRGSRRGPGGDGLYQ